MKTILEQETLVKEFLNELNKFVGKEIIFAQFNPRNFLLDKGFLKSETEKILNYLQDKKLLEIEIKMGRYGSRFRVPKFIEYEDVLQWRTQAASNKVKSNAKIEVKEKPAPKVAEDKVVKPKEYKLGQVVYYLEDNTLHKGKLICMELCKNAYAKDVTQVKNSDIEYTILSETGGKLCLEVFEFSDTVEGLFGILKQRFNNQNK